MKLIEAMKKIKQLTVKADDLRDKIAKHSADLDYETPLYTDQKAQVDSWLQAHHDVLKEIAELKVAIQRTNLLTPVTIEIGGKSVTKSISEWIIRRQLHAKAELDAWAKLTDRNLREGSIQQSTGVVKEVKIRRYYDPKQRDEKVYEYKNEPHQIDAALEVTNAVTELA